MGFRSSSDQGGCGMRQARRLGGAGALLVFAVITGLVVRSHIPPPNPSLTYLDTHGMTAFSLHATEPITMAKAEQMVRRSILYFPPPVQTAPMAAELLRLRARHGGPSHLEPVWLITWTGTAYAPLVITGAIASRYSRYVAANPHMNAVVSGVSGKLLFFFASP